MIQNQYSKNSSCNPLLKDNQNQSGSGISFLLYKDLVMQIYDEEFDELQLQYRGEGNENMIFKVPSIPLVVRFRKSENAPCKNECLENLSITSSFKFQYLFVKSFFSNYFTVPIIAEVNVAKVIELDEKIHCERPDFRKDKRLFQNGIEIYPDYTFLPTFKSYLHSKQNPNSFQDGISLNSKLYKSYLEYKQFISSVIRNYETRNLLKNLCYSNANTMAIEIKPKQGWTAKNDRKSACAFCMNQFLKLSTSKIDTRSDYCPLDLFSGNIARMKKALVALFKEPQNNLRIFKNGNLVFGEDNKKDIGSVLCEWFQEVSIQGCMDNFISLLCQVLLGEWISTPEELNILPQLEPYLNSNPSFPLHEHINVDILNERMSYYRCNAENNLPVNSILNRILRLQQLDQVGIHTVYDYLKTHETEFSSDLSYVEDMIVRTAVIHSNGDDLRIVKLNVVHAYLLSALAKDLSVLIALRPLDSKQPSIHPIISDDFGMKYEASTSVIDVGPKPVSCIEKHWKRDQKVLAACAEYFCPEYFKK